MATNWVISGECQNFPLMYHWRMLPRPTPKSPTREEISEVERQVAYWEEAEGVRTRLMSNLTASADIVLFLEHIPKPLNKWLGEHLVGDATTAQFALTMVEHDIKAVARFMNDHGLLHFDAHFANILTDGELLYFTDFGLAISSRFELSKKELEFFKLHRDYDRYYLAMNLAHWALPSSMTTEERNAILRGIVSGNQVLNLSPSVISILERYAPVAVIMKNFSQSLAHTKTTPYPAEKLVRASP